MAGEQGSAKAESGRALAALAERIQQGDASAEAELAQRFSRGLVFFLRRQVREEELAWDLSQETLRICLERIRAGEVRQPERLAGFLRGTAQNLARSERRKRARRAREQGIDVGPPPEDPREGALSKLLRQEEAALVRQLLEELPTERDRQILSRFCLEEDDKEDVCEALGLTSLQFNLVLFRARKRFRALYEQAKEEDR